MKQNCVHSCENKCFQQLFKGIVNIAYPHYMSWRPPTLLEVIYSGKNSAYINYQSALKQMRRVPSSLIKKGKQCWSVTLISQCRHHYHATLLATHLPIHQSTNQPTSQPTHPIKNHCQSVSQTASHPSTTHPPNALNYGNKLRHVLVLVYQNIHSTVESNHHHRASFLSECTP